MTPQEMIRANAEMVVEKMREVSQREDFGYNADSVEFLDGFIERQRLRPEMTEEASGQMVSNLGSFLGECVIACYGGAWQQEEGTWSVAFDNANAVFPFNKVRKQFANGSEDSIYDWFQAIPALFAKSISQSPPPQKKPWWKWGR